MYPPFLGLKREEIEKAIDAVSYHVEHYDKEETVLRMMDEANRIGIVLSGRIEGQKTFPNGSQVNVVVRGPGEMIGPAAAFSKACKYPCSFVALLAALLYDRKYT